VLTIPYADAAGVARVMAVYALVFGVILALAAFVVARGAREI
jgi:hypothetical protein